MADIFFVSLGEKSVKWMFALFFALWVKSVGWGSGCWCFKVFLRQKTWVWSCFVVFCWEEDVFLFSIDNNYFIVHHIMTWKHFVSL